MIAITPFLFQVEGDYQVELMKNENGEFHAIKMFWDDGWTEIINKAK